tara:strand:- start:512 stop:733 length:222 start_codon:yes stop_codon:yes gene_type:complete
MFLILATKSLNDGTKGFRFNLLGQKGFARKRKHTSRGWFTTNVGDTFRQFHFGKFTVAFERKVSNPKLRHFAG